MSDMAAAVFAIIGVNFTLTCGLAGVGVWASKMMMATLRAEMRAGFAEVEAGFTGVRSELVIANHRLTALEEAVGIPAPPPLRGV
jgi:hypothetical protein